MTTAQSTPTKPARSRTASIPQIRDLTSDDRGVSVTTLAPEQSYAVQFAFNRDMVQKMRRIEGAEYIKDEGVWMVPASQADLLAETVEGLRNEWAVTQDAHKDIEAKAFTISAQIHKANGVAAGVEPKINDYHAAGENNVGEVVIVNSRYAAQHTGNGTKDGAAFLKIHRLSDLNEQLFAGQHAVVKYNENGRGEVSLYEPQAEKVKRLDASMGKYVDGVKVIQDGDKYVVQFDYNPVLASRIGPIVGAEFHKDEKVWTVDVANKDVLARAVSDMRKEVVADRSEREDLIALGAGRIDGAKINNAFTKDGQAHTGEVLARTDRYVLQHTGKEFMALHRASALNQVPDAGKKVRIEYQGGKGQVTDRSQSRSSEARGHDR